MSRDWLLRFEGALCTHIGGGEGVFVPVVMPYAILVLVV